MALELGCVKREVEEEPPALLNVFFASSNMKWAEASEGCETGEEEEEEGERRRWRNSRRGRGDGGWERRGGGDGGGDEGGGDDGGG